MESLSRCLSASPPFPTLSKTLKSSPKSLHNCIPISNLPQLQPLLTLNHPISRTKILSTNLPKEPPFINPLELISNPQFFFLFLGLSLPDSCSAAEEVSGRINLESVLVSIDNFFTRYPFFVATVTFIWLVAIPLTEEYLQKYKFISAIDAFKKLKEDPNAQLLDIRDSGSLAYLSSPNLTILDKSALQVDFPEGDDEGFIRRVLTNVRDPANTTLCVLDNFDGNSIKVAELLVKNGFKEAYAVRGGIRGQKGWQDIQESLLPLSVRVYPKKNAKMTKQPGTNGAILQQDGKNNTSPNESSGAEKSGNKVNNPDLTSIIHTHPIQSKGDSRPSSPYPNYPDYKPPSSPTPSKPN